MWLANLGEGSVIVVEHERVFGSEKMGELHAGSVSSGFCWLLG